jgi:hypothetical protein
MWLSYVAIEPFVRRQWPQVLVSWARLLAGDWRDPLVGRDILIGCTAGVLVACLERMEYFAPALLGYPEPSLDTPNLYAMNGRLDFCRGYQWRLRRRCVGAPELPVLRYSARLG